MRSFETAWQLIQRYPGISEWFTCLASDDYITVFKARVSEIVENQPEQAKVC